MDQWVVSCAGEEVFLESFEDAVRSFRTNIENYARSLNCPPCPEYIPFAVGAFFEYKSSEALITDEEIVVEYKLGMLLNSMCFPEADDCTHYNARRKYDPINYHGEIKEFEEKLDIKINCSEEEINVEILLDDNEDNIFLLTNAFIFQDTRKTYYYKSHQVVIICDSHESYRLGTSVDADITLKYMSKGSDDPTYLY